MNITKQLGRQLIGGCCYRFSALFLCLGFMVAFQSVYAEGEHAEGELKVDPRAEDFHAVNRRFSENCAVCHGDKLQGGAQGVALVGRELTYGDSIEALMKSIRNGFPERGMPAWGKSMQDSDIQALAIFINERRVGWVNGNFNVSEPMQIPSGVVKSEKQAFVLEILADNIDRLPYSFDYLPDGRILVTEKHYGLAVIDRKGNKTYIENTPPVSNDSIIFQELVQGTGWMLGVAVHPEYKKNGWVYLAYGDICEDCELTEPGSPTKPAMTRLVRGRIKGNQWVDQQDIWKAKKKHYSQMTDMVAGGIITFADREHLFMTVGHKGGYIAGIQDVTTPYGKVLRLHDDGRIPEDNPYVNIPGAERAVWAYGLRNSEGLFYDKRSKKLWASDNGPRGGDEINLIRPALNYGWPLYSLGVNYDGSKVEYGKDLGIDFDLADIEQPVVDLTPSPALANLMVYRGDKFPAWKGDIFLATMKARTLYRIESVGKRKQHIEHLLPGISRIRDVKESPEGYIDVLLEHPEGGKIIRLKPETTK